MDKTCRICPRLFWILSIPAFIWLYVYTASVVILVWLAALFRMKRVVRFLVGFWARSSFVMMLKRLRVTGVENIRRDERYILVANHASLFDILAILAFYPEVAFFGKAYLTRIPVFGRVLQMLDFVPMETLGFRHTKEMLLQLKERSERLTVAIFPEGTRTRTGELSRFRKGFIHLLRATGYKVLPVTLNGFYFFKPAHRFYINFLSPLGVVVHPPLDADDLLEMDDSDIIRQVRDVIQSAYA